MTDIKKIELKDIPAIVNIHIEAFPDFFLTSLGKSFLKTYYKTSIKNKLCVAVCSLDKSNNITGFAVGTLLSKNYYKKLIIKNISLYSWQFLIIFITKPKAIIRLYKNLSKTNNPDDDGLYSELLSIAVANNYKGQGIGKLLLDKFEENALKNNCTKIALTTDYFNNENVINFYKSRGYEIYYDFISFPKRKMYKMIKVL